MRQKKTAGSNDFARLIFFYQSIMYCGYSLTGHRFGLRGPFLNCKLNFCGSRAYHEGVIR